MSKNITFVSEGAQRITAERHGHFLREGWTLERDLQYTDGELLDAAVCYLANAHENFEVAEDYWPWDPSWDKRSKHDDIHSLEIAGSLIAAEIDRILNARRLAAAKQENE